MEKKNNLMRFMALTSLGFSYGIIYLLPYMKAVFYDQMMKATGFTNEQLGLMVTAYTIGTTITYLPGGWVADKFKPKNILTVCLVLNGFLCFAFMLVCTNFTLSMGIWFASALCGGFAFWPAMLKSVRLMGTREEQGRIYGVFEAINGFASLIGSWMMAGVLLVFTDLIAGFQGAVVTMGVLCWLAAIFIWLSFKEHITYNEDALEEKEVITAKDFFRAITMPTVWVPSLLLFGGITMYGTLSYLTPYMENKVGITGALLVAMPFMAAFREYGCRIGGIGGGLMADKVFKSSARWQVVAHLITALLIFSFVIIPTNAPILALAVMFLYGFAVYANRVTTYSMLSELRVPPKVTATAVAIMTLVGYSPDFFIHAMYGNWLDTYGNDGFDKIFTYAGTVGLCCIPVAMVGVWLSNKARKQAVQA